ncbi:MAG: glutamate racemase, partial [Myxococcota bacterium]
AGIDQLILACTHYPAAQPAFEAYFSAVTMINPISATVDVAAKYGRLHRGAGGGLTALTTGSPLTLQTNALRAFGVYFPSVDPAPQLD